MKLKDNMGVYMGGFRGNKRQGGMFNCIIIKGFPGPR